MAATIEICESNESSGESITHNISKTDWGVIDSPNLDPVANAITPGNNSYEKWQRVHVTAMGGSSVIQNVKYYGTSPAANSTHNFNGHITQGTYDGANHKQTTYATPATAATRTPESVPTSAPASANIGIGGSLTGQLTATGYCDYIVAQVRTTASFALGTTITVTYQYDEIAVLLLGLGTLMLKVMEVLSHGLFARVWM